MLLSAIRVVNCASPPICGIFSVVLAHFELSTRVNGNVVASAQHTFLVVSNLDAITIVCRNASAVCFAFCIQFSIVLVAAFVFDGLQWRIEGTEA